MDMSQIVWLCYTGQHSVGDKRQVATQATALFHYIPIMAW